MPYYHYADKEITALDKNKYTEQERDFFSICFKPLGLWISVEDEYEDDYSWYEWCVNEEFRLHKLKYKHVVTISPQAKILHLKSKQELIAFTELYYAKVGFLETFFHIAWQEVMKRYDGIIIAPYQWECRLEMKTSWYYPWDCASGCIWNTDVLTIALHEIIDTEALKRENMPTV